MMVALIAYLDVIGIGPPVYPAGDSSNGFQKGVE
jgi:hypothetical protein